MPKWNFEGLNLPEGRAEQSYANAVWIQRNLYLHNEGFKARALEEEVRRFLRAADFRRDVVSRRI
jgi:hypothetical protein